MNQNTLILIFIAGLFLAMIAIAQTPASPPVQNQTSIPVSDGNTTASPVNQTSANTTAGQYVQGELLVRFNQEAFPNANALSASSMEVHATIGAVKVDDYLDLPGLQLVRLPPSMTVDQGIAYYQTIPTVMYAETNAIYSIANTTGPAGTNTSPPPAGNTTGTGDLFVKYNATAFSSPVDLQKYASAANAAINATLVTDYTAYGMPGLQLVNLTANMTPAQGIAYYQNVTFVVYAEPNVQYQAVAVNQTGNATPGKTG